MWSGGTTQVGTSSAEARQQAQLHGKWWLRVMKGVVQAHEAAEPAPQRPHPSLEATAGSARSQRELLDPEAGFYGGSSQAARDQEVARLHEALERQRASAEEKVRELQEALASERSKGSDLAGTFLELEAARQENAGLRESLEIERTRSQRALRAAKEGTVAELAKLEAEGLVVFLVDNTFLKATTDGLGYRRTKKMSDRAGENAEHIANWGATVSGIDHQDGWVQVGEYFLPKVVNGKRVLSTDIYWVDRRAIKATTDGLAFRKSKDFEDKDVPTSIARWGSFVTGVDEGDGWLRVGELYLPFKVNNHSVLVKHVRLEQKVEVKPRTLALSDPPPALEKSASNDSWSEVETVSPGARAQKGDMPRRILTATAEILSQLDKMDVFSDSSGSPQRSPQVKRATTAPALGSRDNSISPKSSAKSAPERSLENKERSKSDSRSDRKKLVFSSEAPEVRELPDTSAQEDELDAKSRELAAKDDELASKRRMVEAQLSEIQEKVSNLQLRNSTAEKVCFGYEVSTETPMVQEQKPEAEKAEAGFVREDSTFNAMIEEVTQLRLERDTLQAAIQKHMDERGMTDQEMVSEVLIPEGLRPGDDFIAATPDGNQIPVRVPDDAYGGCMMEFTYKVHLPEGMPLLQRVQMLLEAQQERDAQYAAQAESLEVALQDARQNLSSLATEHSTLGSEHSSLHAKHRGLAEEHHGLAEEHRSLHAKHTGLAEEHRGLADQHQRLTAEATTSRRDLSVAQENLVSMQETNQQLTMERDELINQVAQANLQSAEDDTSTLALQADLQRYKAECANLEDLNQQLTGQVRANEARITEFEATIQRLASDYDVMLQDREHLTTQAKERELLQGQMQTITGDYEALAESHRNKTIEAEEWRMRASALQQDVQELQAREPTVIHRESTATGETLQAYEAEINQLQSERTVLIEELAQMNLKAQQMEVELEEAQQLRENQGTVSEEQVQVAKLEEEFLQLQESCEARISMLLNENSGLKEQLSSREVASTNSAELQALAAENQNLMAQAASADSIQKTLQAENDRLMAEIMSTGSAKNTLQTAHDQLVDEVAAVSTAYQALQDERNTLVAEIEAAGSIHRALHAENERLASEVVSVNSAHQSLQIEKSQLMSDMSSAEPELQRLQAENQQLMSDITSAAPELERLQAENKELLSEVAFINASHSALQAEKNKLMSDASSTTPELQRLQAENQKLTAELSVMKVAAPELARVQGENDQLMKEINSIVPEHAELRVENDRLKSELIAILPQHKELREENERLQADASALIPEFQQLQVENRELQGENAKFIPALQELQSENEKLMAERQSNQAEVQMLQVQNQQLQAQTASSGPELKRLQAQTEQLLGEIATATPVMEQLQAENRRLLSQVSEAGKAQEALQEENQRLLSELGGAGSAVMIPALDNTAGSAATMCPRGLDAAAEAPAQQGPQANPQAIMMAEKWVSSYKACPVQNTPSLIYLNRIPVVFDEFASTLAPVAAANAPYRSLVLQEIESGSLMRRALETYKARDTECVGSLAWTTGAVRDFVAEVFEQKGLSAPSDAQIYELFLQFDQDSSWSLTVNECLCLADAAFRTVFLYPEAELEPAAEAERAQLTRGITVEFPLEAPVVSTTGTPKQGTSRQGSFAGSSAPAQVTTEQLQPQPVMKVREIVAEPVTKYAEVITEPLQPQTVTKYAEVISEPLTPHPVTKYAEVISEPLQPRLVTTRSAESSAPTSPVPVRAKVLERGLAPSGSSTPKLSTAPRVVKAQEVRKAESPKAAAVPVRISSYTPSGIQGLGTPGGIQGLGTPGGISGMGTPGGAGTPSLPPRMAQVLEPAAMAPRRVQASSSTTVGTGSIAGEAARPAVIASTSASAAPTASPARTYTVQSGNSIEAAPTATVTRQSSYTRAEVLSSRGEGLGSYGAPSLAPRSVTPLQAEPLAPRRISSYSPPAAEILTPSRAPAKADPALSSASAQGMKRLDPARVSQRR